MVWVGCSEGGYTDTCWQSVPWVTWEEVTGVEGYYYTHLLIGLSSTQAIVEGNVLKAMSLG